MPVIINKTSNKKMKVSLKNDIMGLQEQQISYPERTFIMTDYNILGSNLKRNILRFSEKISSEMTRPKFKFVSQMLYGILAAGSCLLSEIGRKLDEKTSLKKTIDRLSRNMKNFDEEDRAMLFEGYIKTIMPCFSENTVLLIDNGDITKPCSPTFEAITKVMDGSTGEIADGYNVLEITALSAEKKMPFSVYSRVYSTIEKNFVSENKEVLDGLDFISKHFSPETIRAFDRGYDNNLYFKRLIDQNEKFIIRTKKNRDVIYKGKRLNILELAKRFKGKYSLKFQKKNGFKANCRISIVSIELPCRPGIKLNLVICNGIGIEPLMLITNLNSEDSRLSVTITKVYLLRWRIEEFYRFKKQKFEFEDLRVRSLNAIRNMNMLTSIVVGFTAKMSEKGDSSSIVFDILTLSKRIFGIAKFNLYAIADGIVHVLSNVSASHKCLKTAEQP